MITPFSVGAVFELVDRASPELRRLMETIKQLNVAIKAATDSMRILASPAAMPAMGAALKEVQGLTAEWRAVGIAADRSAAQVKAASASMARSNRVAAGLPASARQRVAAVRAGGAGGGHVTVPPVPLGGGAHFHGGGGLAMGLAGLGLYGGFEAAQLEDSITKALWHEDPTKSMQDPARRKVIRDIIEKTMSESGMPMDDIGKAAQQELRMFKGTPGGGLPVLPEMLRAAWIEAKLKGTTVEAAMESFTGLAHMTGNYSPEDIKKLAPAFAFLSTANPASLKSIERAASYAVPFLHSGLDIDPLDTLLLGTVMTRAGVTSTKSGTWLREMATRAMPGTSLMSKMAFKKHESALKQLGLVDEEGKPTWFTGGKPDLLKMIDIASEHAAKIPLTERAGLERQLFGAQGSGAFATLANPAIREQIGNLKGEMAGFEGAYPNFMEEYRAASPVQQFRTTMADLKIVLMDIASIALPGVLAGLQALDDLLKVLKGDLPSGKLSMGGAAITGAAIGAGIGLGMGGPLGAIAGAGIGALTGGATWNAVQPGEPAWGTRGLPTGPSQTWPFGSPSEEAPKKMNYLMGPPPQGGGGSSQGGSVFLDSTKVGSIVVDYIAGQGAKALEGSSHFDQTRGSYAPDVSTSTLS